MKNRTDGTTTAETPEELLAHMSRLMEEAESMLVGPVAEQTGGRFQELKARLDAAQTRLASLYGDARKKVVDGAKFTDETIRSHPYESLAVALGVGVLLGALLRRNA